LRKSVIQILLVALIAALPGSAKTQKSKSSSTQSTASASSKNSSSAKKKTGTATSSSSKRSSSKTASSRQPASKGCGTSTSRTAHKGKGHIGANGRTAQEPKRAYQQAPTSDRYREIQHALAEKGFFKGEENGVWGPESVEALKTFQREQNLNATGKLDSVSLIALGLGPKRGTTADFNPLLIQRPQDDNRRTEGSERP
jgi:peptidoglycan hydrolase-like protein with peptidoglycan-binding domain